MRVDSMGLARELSARRVGTYDDESWSEVSWKLKSSSLSLLVTSLYSSAICLIRCSLSACSFSHSLFYL